MLIQKLFFSFIHDAILHSGHPNQDGRPSILLGNVEFWEEQGEVAYSIPTAQWDVPTLQSELARAVALAPDYPLIGRANGYEVVRTAAGFQALIEGEHVGGVHGDPRLVWRELCIERGLVPTNRVDYAGMIARAVQAEKAASPLQTVAMRHDYVLCSWEVTELGRDMYYWKKKGSMAEPDRSAQVFTSEEDAWRDCCLRNNLLGEYQVLAKQNGYVLGVSDFWIKQFYWQTPDATRTGTNCQTQAEAWLDCCLANRIGTEQEVCVEAEPTTDAMSM